MRCPECGQRLMEGAHRCPSCGISLDPSQLVPDEEIRSGGYEEDYPEDEGARITLDAGEYRDRFSSQRDLDAMEQRDPRRDTGYGSPFAQRQKRAARGQKGLGMKWYYFLVYFSLLATVILNGGTGIIQVAGIMMGEKSAVTAAYADAPMLLYVDVAYGLVCIAFGVFAFKTRQDLKAMRSKGPRELILLYGISGIMQLVYELCYVLTGAAETFDVTAFGTVIVAVIMMLINKMYFDNRRDMFTN